MADYSHETCHVAYPVHVVFEHGGVNAADELEREPDRPNREDCLCNVAEKLIGKLKFDEREAMSVN